MECYFINLQNAEERRKEITRNFSEMAAPGWHLDRFAAIDAEYVRLNQIPGTKRDAEKACFLSHTFVLQQCRRSERTIWVMEDDAVFGRQTCSLAESVIGSIDPESWDIIFTDIIVTTVNAMVDLVAARRQLMVNRTVQLVNLASFPFAGATSYIVNGKSLERVCSILGSFRSIDVPYDLYVRNQVHNSNIRAIVIVPFITTLSSRAEFSSIQDNDALSPDRVLNLFRRLFWVDRNVAEHRSAISELEKTFCDDESKMFSTLFAAMVSGRIRWK
ncbi:MAG TPA: glycosyltransferase family 25 protein [Rhizomicrobium sp.]|jgi:GR25 family glycosyltransferase involved in LPS biosynthesis|nr:glycosyltransferase family 25 protein [Rhizomicrobium sp.]